MSRIVAGIARGRRLRVPTGQQTRPTSDRVREALFASLAADFGSLEDLRFLDLYAGSGAVGLEARSRGAAEVLLIESNRSAAEVIEANVAAVGLGGVTVRVGAVERLVGSAPAAPYDIVFLDPPYDVPETEVGEVLRLLAANDWLTDDAAVVVERATRGGAFPWPDGFAGDRSRRYGDTTLWYGRAANPSQ